MLRIDTTQYATVCELISHYEHCFGVLSLRKWKYILKKLGYEEHFQRLMAAEKMIVDDIGDMDDIIDSPFLAAPKHVPSRDRFGARYISSSSDPPISNQARRGRKSSRRSQSKEFIPKDGEGNIPAKTCLM